MTQPVGTGTAATSGTSHTTWTVGGIPIPAPTEPAPYGYNVPASGGTPTPITAEQDAAHAAAIAAYNARYQKA